MIEMGVEGEDDAARNLDEIRRRTHAAGIAWAEHWGGRIAAGARRRLTRKGGGRDTGRLAGSIDDQVIVREDEIMSKIATNVPYAIYQEGYRPGHPDEFIYPPKHFVPFRVAPGLLEWAIRHKVISRGRVKSAAEAYDQAHGGLVVGGPDSIHPFLRPSLKEHEDKAQRDLERRVRAVCSRRS